MTDVFVISIGASLSFEMADPTIRSSKVPITLSLSGFRVQNPFIYLHFSLKSWFYHTNEHNTLPVSFLFDIIQFVQIYTLIK